MALTEKELMKKEPKQFHEMTFGYLEVLLLLQQAFENGAKAMTNKPYRGSVEILDGYVKNLEDGSDSKAEG